MLTKKSVVVEECPEREGRVLAEDLFVGMKLQPHPPQGQYPFTVIAMGDEEYFRADIHFDDGTSPMSRTISKADKGMQPYANGLWNTRNWCTVIEEAPDA